MNERYVCDPNFQHLRYMTRFVPGRGSVRPKVVFVGDVPNPEESAAGRPGVGSTGVILADSLRGAELKTEHVYLTYFLKYRPHQGRDPKPMEITTTRPYLYQEISILQPDVIVLLGRFVTKMLFHNLPWAEIRGNVIWDRGFAYVPTVSPTSILANPMGRSLLVQDMTTVGNLL